MIDAKLKNLTKELFEKYLEEGLNFKQIGEIYGASGSSISSKAKKLNIIKERKYNIHVFDNIDTEEKAYWLGFLFADGCVYNSPKRYALSLALKATDYDHVKKFKNFLEDTRDDSVIKVSTINKNNKSYSEARYVVCSIDIVRKLVSYGCVPRKSLILKFPEESIFKEKKLIFDFIRGYIDGDGCLCSKGKNQRLYISINGTYDFLSKIKEYFPTFYKVSKRGNIYSLEVGCDKADEIATILYENSTIYLDRKYKKFITLRRLHTTSDDASNLG